MAATAEQGGSVTLVTKHPTNQINDNSHSFNYHVLSIQGESQASPLVRSGYVTLNGLFFCCVYFTQPEIQQNYIRLQNDLQALARKIGELESEADEHRCFLYLHLQIPPRILITAP